MNMQQVVYLTLTEMCLAGAAMVALSRNIFWSAMGLLAALLGTGGLYAMLGADFVAITQLLVYIGGVLVLILFAVMLTHHVKDINVSNRSMGLVAGIGLFVVTAATLIFGAANALWKVAAVPATGETTMSIGNAFLSTWLLPFEVASLVLLATLVGAIVIARKELKAD